MNAVRCVSFLCIPELTQLKDANNEQDREPTPPPEEGRPYKRVKVLDLEEPALNWLPTTSATAPSSDKGWATMPVIDGWSRPRPPELPNKQAIEAVIAAARASAVAATLQKAEEEARELAKAEERVKQMEKRQTRKEKEKQKPTLSKEEKEALKEKKLKKMVGAVVVKTMSKYQKYMDHDQFKKYAKEVRHSPLCPSPC
jgi:hypothetical protein